MFLWNEGNTNHIARHGVTPAEAEQVVLNEPLDMEVTLRNGEQRIVQVGETDAGRILVVVTTMRGTKIRVVTPYPAGSRLQQLFQRIKRRFDAGQTGNTTL